MSDYSVVSQQVVFDHPMARIVIDTLEHAGVRRPYFYLASPVESVATVAVTPNNEIILTRQYRHPIGRVIFDLPAGSLKPGEDPYDGAMREFEEETGFLPHHIEKLGYYNQFPGSLRAGTHLYFARDLNPTLQHLDDGEELDIAMLPVGVIIQMILNGELIDGSLQLGVLLAVQKGLINL